MEASYTIERGRPNPLGSVKCDDGVNFAFYSPIEKDVSLLLYTPGTQVPFAEFQLDPLHHRTGNIWHVKVKNICSVFDYGIKIGEKILIDPYARYLNITHEWRDFFYTSHRPLARFKEPAPFNWEDDAPPLIPPQDLIIYEMHVRGYTEDPSSHVQNPGTFLGMIEKIPHLKELGVNAVEFLPIFEFDECENPKKDPETGKPLLNYWGYSTVNFFSLMNRYGTSSHECQILHEFKTLVKELHKNRIEVTLDVVYNHTAEGNGDGRTLSFRGFDEKTYYILGPNGEYMNYTGCGNTFNCNHPVVSQLILDSLRYWVSEMHIDGFRFDLASILTRDENGHPLADPPVVRAISEDALLSNVKLIAEAWDAAGLYQVGSFPSYQRWGEWNGKYRDVVRRFIKGTDNNAGAFAGVLSGSQDLYGHDRKPYHSINFITAHDGFSLRDLVCYNDKHNLANGENNQDGASDNESWNCGAEGDTSNVKIIRLRERQMKNFVVALFVSLGTPMMLMGDEYGLTHLGNNNPWCHDGPLNAFQWNMLAQHQELFRFFKSMIAFRKTNHLVRRTEFLKPEDIDWHGTIPFEPDWGPTSRFVAYALKDQIKEEHLYIAFNASSIRPTVQLPPLPAHKKWYRLVDTSLDFPHDYIDSPTQFAPLKTVCKMEAYSSMVLVAL